MHHPRCPVTFLAELASYPACLTPQQPPFKEAWTTQAAMTGTPEPAHEKLLLFSSSPARLLSGQSFQVPCRPPEPRLLCLELAPAPLQHPVHSGRGKSPGSCTAPWLCCGLSSGPLAFQVALPSHGHPPGSQGWEGF